MLLSLKMLLLGECLLGQLSTALTHEGDSRKRELGLGISDSELLTAAMTKTSSPAIFYTAIETETGTS